jgi:hypothetical protein
MITTEVILDSGYIEVFAKVDVDEDEIIITEVWYDNQRVSVDKVHPELERQIEEVAENEWAMGYDES